MRFDAPCIHQLQLYAASPHTADPQSGTRHRQTRIWFLESARCVVMRDPIGDGLTRQSAARYSICESEGSAQHLGKVRFAKVLRR